MYVNDGLVLSHSLKDAKETIKEIENKSKEFGLKLNKDKCRIMIISENQEIQNVEGIKVVQEIKYLGITIENKRNCFIKQKKTAIEKAGRFNNILY